MDEEISIQVKMPLDGDGFLRRQCPNCEQQFKWYAHEAGDTDAQLVEQYFCPLCGEPSGTDTWWTPAQLEYATGAAGPELDQHVGDLIADAFKDMKGIQFKHDRKFSLEFPTPDPLNEPDDMVIVEPPCHPNEPLKVPDATAQRLHCIVCGEPFAC